ncbi:MAG: DUF4298 domain-containing protein [Oscillospiraceae bacterium]|nr:DUF4298 domain-containing protein [Oscillospiraceae bacterium]
MFKVYGCQICINCRNYKAIQKSRGFEAEYIDITESTENMKEFLTIRDTEPMYEPVREKHKIGIPLFVREDGLKTFDMDEAFSWIGQPPVREEEIVEKKDHASAIERIQKMEEIFDSLLKAQPQALNEDPDLKEQLQILSEYYEGGQWLRDYELDEKGLLPKDLKRGVLSQDAVYDFLSSLKG